MANVGAEMKNEKELQDAQVLLDSIMNQLEKKPWAIPNLIDDPSKGDYAEVLSNLVYLLTNLSMDPVEAKYLMEETFKTRIRMGECLNRPVDFRVALLDLILQKKEFIKNPKVIEIKLYLEQEKKAMIDYLTGLYNKRYYEETMDREINQAKRYSRSFSIILFDIDNFKLVNDTFGHSLGDEVLKILATILKKNVRKEDTLCRAGGEEFVIILPDTASEGARKVAEKIREAFHEETLNDSKLSLSGGIATYPNDGNNKSELFECADKAMYFSKFSGKNKITVFGEEIRNARA
ncbi:MAG: GGDEF domain-containing protein [Leptospira sp.]|nr:GGDEF domain-containing protein [Leptospira sp.]